MSISLLVRANLPQLRSALVAEQRVPTAGQHGRHPTSESIDLDVSDREDPAMKTAEATGGPAVLNGAWGEAKLEELAAGDHRRAGGAPPPKRDGSLDQFASL